MRQATYENCPNGVSLSVACVDIREIQYQSDDRLFTEPATTTTSSCTKPLRTFKGYDLITRYNLSAIVNTNVKSSCLMRYGKAQRGRSIKPSYYWIQMLPPRPPTPPRLMGMRWQWRMIRKLNLNNSQIDSKNCRSFVHNCLINSALLVS